MQTEKLENESIMKLCLTHEKITESELVQELEVYLKEYYIFRNLKNCGDCLAITFPNRETFTIFVTKMSK